MKPEFSPSTLPTRTCASCTYWSEYTAGVGECLEYVARRRDAFSRADDTVAFHEAWPHKAAIDTIDSHSCEHFAPERANA